MKCQNELYEDHPRIVNEDVDLVLLLDTLDERVDGVAVGEVAVLRAGAHDFRAGGLESIGHRLADAAVGTSDERSLAG